MTIIQTRSKPPYLIGLALACLALISSADLAGLEDSVRKAFFALGQALHGVQDFYAHSNYVELSKAQAKKTQDIAVVAPWRKSGKARIKEMGGARLVSSYVFWGLPQQCPKGSITHADLAKDKDSTRSGAVKVPHLQNQSQYQIAAYLARRASEMFLADAFLRWPLLKEVNGRLVAFRGAGGPARSLRCPGVFTPQCCQP